jgi:hypothetical protein
MKNYPLPKEISWFRLPEWVKKLTGRVAILEQLISSISTTNQITKDLAVQVSSAGTTVSVDAVFKNTLDADFTLTRLSTGVYELAFPTLDSGYIGERVKVLVGLTDRIDRDASVRFTAKLNSNKGVRFTIGRYNGGTGVFTLADDVMKEMNIEVQIAIPS